MSTDIMQIYFNNEFLIDVLACFPFDYCLYGLLNDPKFPGYLRVITFFFNKNIQIKINSL